MNKILAIALAAATLAAGTAAEARDGCGRGFFRGPYGHCRPERGGVIVAPGVVVGGFYPAAAIGTGTATGSIANIGAVAGATAKSSLLSDLRPRRG